MSRFFAARYQSLVPYTPGEQPKERQYVKLNTNESPYPPSPKAIAGARQAAERLQLYSDPECKVLTQRLAKRYGVSEKEVLCTNGSDEILNFAFMAFGQNGVAFADITYGFYEVFADLHGIPKQIIALKEDFSICPQDYHHLGKTIFIANPNAPTGLCLSVSEIEEILRTNRDSVVVIDEAYVDFGAQSCVPLIAKYDNLLVTQTFSKSRSMAGARLGFGIGNAELIRDLNTIKYSTNPYNINAMTMAAGEGVLCDEAYTQQNCQTIIRTREKTKQALQAMGFSVLDSQTNFLFARHKTLTGQACYEALRHRGILVRHFSAPRIAEYNRITIGSESEMEFFIEQMQQILEETQ